MSWRGPGRRHGKAPDLVTLPALRSLLRYLHVAGLIGAPLAGAVPAGRGYRGRRNPLESRGGVLGPVRDQLHWSAWRRHPATARNCHYQRRQALALT
jgi:hypothetical protein